MEMNGTMLNKEDCENAKEIVSKYGVTLVCDEEDKAVNADVVLPASEQCENMKTVASKVGLTVVCDEEA